MPRKSSRRSATGQQEMLLPGSGKRKPPPHLPEKTAPQRIFVALMPGMQAAVKACSVAENISHEQRLAASLRPPRILHMTLCFIGDYLNTPHPVLFGASEALSRLVTPDFEARLDHAVDFRVRNGQRALVLCSSQPNDALSFLQQQVVEVLSEAGVISSRPGGFTPHMTLFYHQRQTPIETWWLDEPIVWRAGGFRLIESFYGQTRYVNHGDWPLSLDHG